MKSRFFVFALIAFLAAPPAVAGAYEDMEEAIIRNDSAAAIALLKRGMDVNTVDRQGNSLLIQAIRADLPELFDFLMQRRARVNLRNASGETPLAIAAFLGRERYARRLVAAGAEINYFGWAPLAYAAYNGHTKIVELLLSKGAEIDAQNESGATALFFASRFGHIDAVRLLLKRGADPSIANDRGETAVDWAVKGKNTDIEDILRAAGGRSGHSVTIDLSK